MRHYSPKQIAAIIAGLVQSTGMGVSAAQPTTAPSSSSKDIFCKGSQTVSGHAETIEYTERAASSQNQKDISEKTPIRKIKYSGGGGCALLPYTYYEVRGIKDAPLWALFAALRNIPHEEYGETQVSGYGGFVAYKGLFKDAKLNAQESLQVLIEVRKHIRSGSMTSDERAQAIAAINDALNVKFDDEASKSTPDQVERYHRDLELAKKQIEASMPTTQPLTKS